MLTHCPICKYDLTGLPDRHACPECGYDFDRDSEIIQLEPPPPRWLWWLFTVLGLYSVFSIVLLAKTIPNSLMFALPLIPFLGIYFSFRPNRPAAVIRSWEIQIIRRRAIAERYSLDGVALAEWQIVNGGVLLLDSEKRELGHIHRAPRWSANATKRLAAVINKRLQSKTVNDS